MAAFGNRPHLAERTDSCPILKQPVANDLDGTLSESKQPIDPETSALPARLTELAVVAVIPGGAWP